VADRVIRLVFDAIDINEVLTLIDLNALLDQVDLNAVLDKLDVNALVDKLDVNALVAKLDMNTLISEIDVDKMLTQTELGTVIGHSTTSVLTSLLDLIRSLTVGMDDWLGRTTNRILRRSPDSLPKGPPRLVAAADATATSP